ncbi:MAG: glycosyltransferase family 4 protein [Candidatus Saccharibacteria bacterium]
MKIGLVCPYNIFKSGGVQECVLAIFHELNNRGYDAYIISPAPKIIPESYDQKILLIGRSTDLKSPFHTTSQISVSVNTESLTRELHKHNFDIIHFHEPWVPILSRQILSRSKAKNIATFHAKLPDTVMSKTIEAIITPYTKSVLKYLDTLTAVSDAGAVYIRSLTEKNVRIIPNGIDLNLYKSSVKSSSGPNILYIGRLEKRKGIKYLLQAYSLVLNQNPETKLLIAGDGPDREKLESLAKKLELDKVKFLGYVADDKKMELLANATVFCSPALFGESFGIVLLEAMACGIPIVAGDNPGYSSVMKGKGSLSLVNPKDSEEFARKLNIMLYDEDIRTLWKAWALEYVKQFSYKNIIDQYEDLYKQTVK